MQGKRDVWGPLGLIVLILAVITWSGGAVAAPSKDLWPLWQAHVEGSTQIVDHSAWDMFLKEYVVSNHPSGINRLRYSDVSSTDRQKLHMYLRRLQGVKVSKLNRKEQEAFWVNLYNAMTVKVILDHYPVKSIMDIDISPGFFSKGPWGARLMNIEGEKVSLNDIEHRILRPIFQDNRLHYALNCASLGCPNLNPTAYTAANLEGLLGKAAKAYVNHPRGVKMIKGRLQVSSIYKWFQVDFGGSEKGVVRHLLLYAQGDLVNVLQSYRRGLRYDYNWGLNDK